MNNIILESTNVASEQQAVPVALSRQLEAATDANACFCIGCGQPDEPELHDRMRCPAMGGKLDAVPVATALEVYDDSCEDEPELDGEARALHCVITALSARQAFVAIGEEKLRASRAADRNAKPDGTLEALETCANMLENYMPECMPANEYGQVDFVRCMTDATVSEIRAFIANTRAGTAE